MIPMNLKVYKHKVCLLHITSKPKKMDFLVKEIGMKPDNARRFLEHSVDVKNEFLDLLEMVPLETMLEEDAIQNWRRHCLENHSLEDSIADFIYNYPMGSEPETMNETEINNCPIFYNEPLEYMDSSQYMFHGTPSWTEAFQLCYQIKPCSNELRLDFGGAFYTSSDFQDVKRQTMLRKLNQIHGQEELLKFAVIILEKPSCQIDLVSEPDMIDCILWNRFHCDRHHKIIHMAPKLQLDNDVLYGPQYRYKKLDELPNPVTSLPFRKKADGTMYDQYVFRTRKVCKSLKVVCVVLYKSSLDEFNSSIL